MGESENKHCTVLSWADEVEKEEEEAKVQFDQKQTRNPFGSARPREIVLRDRGIDWRKLDQDLQQQRSRISLGPKESIQAPVEPTAEKKQVIPQSKRRIESNIGLHRGNVSQLPLNPHNHMPGILIPQLKYPPRIVPTNLFRATHGSHNFQSPGTGPQNFHSKILIEPDRENAYYDYEVGIEQFSPGLDGHIHHYDCYFDQHKFGMERGSNKRELKETRGESMKAQHNPNFASDLIKLSTREERGPSLIGNRRWLPADQRNWKITSGGNYGRDRVMDGLMNSPPIETIRNRQRTMGHENSRKKEGSYQRNSGSRRVRSAAEGVSWEKIRFENEWQSSPGNVDTVVNGGRAKTSQSMKLKRANSGENYGQSARKRPTGRIADFHMPQRCNTVMP